MNYWCSIHTSFSNAQQGFCQKMLRDYQEDILEDLLSNQKDNPLVAAPTGSGKTVMMASLVESLNTHTLVVAHRREIIAQLACALHFHGIEHSILGPTDIVKYCVRYQIEKTGNHSYTPSAQVDVAMAQTLMRRSGAFKHDAMIFDEAHHYIRGSKWGDIREACGGRAFGFTATPQRTDGKGLGSKASGFFDRLIMGPSTGDLIARGYLAPYKIYDPGSAIDRSKITISKTTGDFSAPSLRMVTKESKIVGDIVRHYLQYAPGKQGLTFAPSIELAEDIAKDFKAAGVSAAVLSGKSKPADRERIDKEFKSGKILQLVNVDLFGEGYDVPEAEVVSMARATESLGWYLQAIGRVLRPSPNKEYGIVLDHVGNCQRHGSPAYPRQWSLADREKSHKKSPGLEKLKTCTSCTAKYDAYMIKCPYCESEPEAVKRSAPEQVDGQLSLLNDEFLDAARQAKARIDTPMEKHMMRFWTHTGTRTQTHQRNMHANNKRAQELLRGAMAVYGGIQKSRGLSDAEIQKIFFLTFGVDTLSAQGLKAKEAYDLLDQVNATITSD